MNTPQERANSRDTLSPFVFEHANVRGALVRLERTSAGRDEIEAALAERGVVDVTCEFCNRRYTFQPEEARPIFVAPPPRQHPTFTGSQER